MFRLMRDAAPAAALNFTFDGRAMTGRAGDTVAAATQYHAHWGQYLLYVLVGLHLLAIVYYAHRRRGLVQAMITGDKTMEPTVPSARDTAATRVLAAVLAVVASGLSWWIYQLGAGASAY